MHYLISSKSQCPLKRRTSPANINSYFEVLMFSVISHAIGDSIGIMGFQIEIKRDIF